MLATSVAGAATPARLDDADIRRAIDAEILGDAVVPYHSMDVGVRDGIVTLKGTVDTILARDRATRLASVIKGVRSVVNQLEVRTPSRRDEDMRADISRRLIEDPATDSYEITVAIRDGVASLRGTVDSWQEKQLARRVAEGIRGVKDVEMNLAIAHEISRPDHEIAADIKGRLAWDARVDDELILVRVNHGKVILSGAVGSALERAYATGDAWVAGVKQVDSSGLDVEWWARDRMRRDKLVFKSDAQVEETVRDAMLYDPRVKSFNPEVHADDGVVTLSGVVDSLQARRAAEEDALNTVGVRAVRNQLRVRPAEGPE